MRNILIVFISVLSLGANAKVLSGETTVGDTFRVDSKEGKVISAREAFQLADKHDIYRCKAIKGAVSDDGKSVVARKCSLVAVEYSDKTGLPKFKREQ